MVKHLLLMRHGHAKPAQGFSDELRELKNKGKRNAQRMGVWLAAHDLIPDKILTSSALRAETTAHKTCKSSGRGTAIVESQSDLYDASSMEILKAIAQTDERVTTLLIVGHNPGLEVALAELSKTAIPKTKKDNYLPPASLAHLLIDCEWHEVKANCAELADMVYPKKLPRTFPFKTTEGVDHRIRPAYYYHQSCVVPFRESNKGLEVLIVSSSSKKHWVVPKGIHDPGLTAQESAAQEAFEEAGIRGEVLEKQLGHYTYEKWEASCNVVAYPMRVNQELSRNEWEESHRMRRWVSVDAAISLIDNEDLATLVAKLPAYLEDQTV